MAITALAPHHCQFPPLAEADDSVGGLLAVGGDLSVTRLRTAYRSGVFPWYNEGEPLLWWSPPERCLLLPERFHCSRSLAKRLRRGDLTVTTNQAFAEVVGGCARRGRVTRNQSATWITAAMRHAYQQLHQCGDAHSVELWQSGNLVAGLYGVQVGALFCGESMYSDLRDGSKALLYYLCQALLEAGFVALDCQLSSPHLLSLGATVEPRQQYIERLEAALRAPRPWPRFPGTVMLAP